MKNLPDTGSTGQNAQNGGTARGYEQEEGETVEATFFKMFGYLQSYPG